MNEDIRKIIKEEIKAERDRVWARAVAHPDFQEYKEHNRIGWMAMSNAAYIAGGRLEEDKVNGLPSEEKVTANV